MDTVEGSFHVAKEHLGRKRLDYPPPLPLVAWYGQRHCRGNVSSESSTCIRSRSDMLNVLAQVAFRASNDHFLFTAIPIIIHYRHLLIP